MVPWVLSADISFQASPAGAEDSTTEVLPGLPGGVRGSFLILCPSGQGGALGALCLAPPGRVPSRTTLMDGYRRAEKPPSPGLRAQAASTVEVVLSHFLVPTRQEPRSRSGQVCRAASPVG